MRKSILYLLFLIMLLAVGAYFHRTVELRATTSDFNCSQLIGGRDFILESSITKNNLFIILDKKVYGQWSKIYNIGLDDGMVIYIDKDSLYSNTVLLKRVLVWNIRG